MNFGLPKLIVHKGLGVCPPVFAPRPAVGGARVVGWVVTAQGACVGGGIPITGGIQGKNAQSLRGRAGEGIPESPY